MALFDPLQNCVSIYPEMDEDVWVGILLVLCLNASKQYLTAIGIVSYDSEDALELMICWNATCLCESLCLNGILHINCA